MISVKGIVQPNILIYSPLGHSRCRWAFFFIRTDFEKYTVTVQMADKNITSIQSNPYDSSTSINVFWIEKLRVCKKQFHN